MSDGDIIHDTEESDKQCRVAEKMLSLGIQHINKNPRNSARWSL